MAIQNTSAWKDGVLRLLPAWVPRSFCRPGRRIKLHPDDYYALGLERGGIDERWFSSTTPADNGPGTPADEGLSYAALPGGGSALLTELIDQGRGEMIGDRIWGEYRKWPMYSKFFDNLGPLPHHVHHDDKHAALVAMSGKPEMYFFPSQVNNHPGEFAYTFFGVEPGVTRAQVKRALMDFSKGDNHLTALSRAYKLRVDTGWDVPPGLLHAPGSLCTYEPQFASDVYAMYQSVLLGDHAVPESLLWKNCPEDRVGDFDYLMEVLDWDLNTDPRFMQHRFMAPKPAAQQADGALIEDICYLCPIIGAQRVTLSPDAKATLAGGEVGYGLICLQGHGSIDGQPLESPALIRFGEETFDEYFVPASVAARGVTFENHSRGEPLVFLRHYPIAK